MHNIFGLNIKLQIMKKALLLIASAFMLSASETQAQNSYNSAVGVRFSNSLLENVNFSYKAFVSRPAAFELNVGLASRRDWFGLSASGSYQYHLPITSNFAWYVGGGIAVGQVFSDYDRYPGTFVGIFPTIGLDLKVREIPINLSLDIRPTVYVARSKYFNSAYPANFGLAIRYTF